MAALNITTTVTTFVYAVRLGKDISKVVQSTTFSTKNLWLTVTCNGEQVLYGNCEQAHAHNLLTKTGDIISVTAYKEGVERPVGTFTGIVQEDGSIPAYVSRGLKEKNVVTRKTLRAYNRPAWAKKLLAEQKEQKSC